MVLDDALVTEREAAQFLGVTTGTMRNKRRAGTSPPYVRLAGASGGVRYSARALVQFVEQHTHNPTGRHGSAP